MKNQVIKVLNQEHGKKVIQYWKNRGVDTIYHSGHSNEKNGHIFIYYGVINNKFDSYSLNQVKANNAEIIELPKEFPKYWVVKKDENNPNWGKVLDYIKLKAGTKLISNFNYFGFDGINRTGFNSWNYIEDFENNPTLLTIDEFVELTEGFVIPEKWFCKPTNKEDAFILGKYFDENRCGWVVSDVFYYQNNLLAILQAGLSNDNYGFSKCQNHTEITFEQFKKYILKDNSEKQKTMKTITPEQALQIIDSFDKKLIKNYLFSFWERDIYEDKAIIVSKDLYNELLEVITPEQKELFDDIFKGEPQYIPKDTPCLVRDDDFLSWKLAYSNGDGNFRTYGIKSSKWNHVQVLDINNLPKF